MVRQEYFFNWNDLLTSQVVFFAMLALALVIGKTPLRHPFKWMETFFHELSHGLMAVLTMGWIKRIQINFDGSGHCITRGGLRIPVLLAGYMGAVIWGAIIYYAGWSSGSVGATGTLKLLMIVVGASTLLWVRHPATLIICLIMLATFAVPVYYPWFTPIPLFLEFTGLFILLSAIKAPLYLIDGQHVGDGAALQDKTFIPEGIWVAFWFLFGLCALILLWALNSQTVERWLSDNVLAYILH